MNFAQVYWGNWWQYMMHSKKKHCNQPGPLLKGFLYQNLEIWGLSTWVFIYYTRISQIYNDLDIHGEEKPSFTFWFRPNKLLIDFHKFVIFKFLMMQEVFGVTFLENEITLQITILTYRQLQTWQGFYVRKILMRPHDQCKHFLVET